MKIDEVEWHIEFGRDSGIPDCCISFWIDEFSPSVGIDYKKEKMWVAFYRTCYPQNIFYIPCPKCVMNKTFIEIKNCPPRRPFPTEREFQNYYGL